MPNVLVDFVTMENSQGPSYSGLLAPVALPKEIASDLRTDLTSVLPVHMVPAVYVPVGNMPDCIRQDRSARAAKVRRAGDQFILTGG